jgi:pyruvate dehydrogenase E2 component (dihydrolipoamide acetyltransferase)
MAIPIVIPREGQSMESAVIADWFVKVGDKVDFAQPICEVESEKATFEVESPLEGYVLEIFFLAGETAPVLKPIAVIGTLGENYSELIPSNDNAPPRVDSTTPLENEPIQNGIIEVLTADDSTQDSKEIKKRRLISPRARKIINEKRIDINEIMGDPINEKTIQSYINNSPRITPAAKDRISKTGEILPVAGTGLGGRITVDDLDHDVKETNGNEIRGVRKIIADRMHASLQKTAQFTLNYYADATGLVGVRRRLKNSAFEGANITINDILLFIAARALKEYPQINAHFANGVYTQHKRINLGFAVDAKEGLVVPVIKNADELGLKYISLEAKRLVTACMSNKIASKDLSDGTFTISNLGSLGIDTFTPILNYPEVGILGVGAIKLQPVRKNDEVIFQEQIALSLTVNHQVIDGALGARFLKTIANYLENIEELLFVQ